MKSMIAFIKKLIPFFALFEGVDHLILSAFSFYGFYRDKLGIVDHWQIWITPLADTVFGVMSIVSGLMLRGLMARKKGE